MRAHRHRYTRSGHYTLPKVMDLTSVQTLQQYPAKARRARTVGVLP